MCLRRTCVQRDFSDIGFSRFANAASVCGHSASVVAARRGSSIRSFVGVDFIRTDTVLSPQLDPTIQTRTLLPFDYVASVSAVSSFFGRAEKQQ